MILHDFHHKYHEYVFTSGIVQLQKIEFSIDVQTHLILLPNISKSCHLKNTNDCNILKKVKQLKSGGSRPSKPKDCQNLAKAYQVYVNFSIKSVKSTGQISQWFSNFFRSSNPKMTQIRPLTPIR